MDYGSGYDYNEGNSSKGWLAGLPPYIRAGIFCGIPFIIIVAINYLTVSISTCIMIPILFLLYCAVGILSVKFSREGGGSTKSPFLMGVFGGLSLWVVSVIANSIGALVTGVVSVGVGLLLTVPYLLCVMPIELIIAGLVAGLAGLIYGSVTGKGTTDSGYSDGNLYG